MKNRRGKRRRNDKMKLYHYRSINSALLELGNGTFHFAAREELNDPLEGFVRVYWQGDKAAWEGLFRHYIYSVGQALELYLIGADEKVLHHNTLIADVHRFDDVPFGSLLRKLGTQFLEEPDVQCLAEFYGGHCLKVSEKELRYIIRLIHSKALVNCLREFQQRNLMEEEEAQHFINFFDRPLPVRKTLEEMDKSLSSEGKRIKIMELAERFAEDMQEFTYMLQASQDDTFLYGNPSADKKNREKRDSVSKAQQHRDWLTVAIDFPKVFVKQLTEMIYPESYVVCFSGKNDDSAMWGNYADCHKGVCLVYDTKDEDKIKVKVSKHYISLAVKSVSYGGNIIERNFFQTFGRLNMQQIKEWLLGTEEISSCYQAAFSEPEKWRERYWETYEAKTYRKTNAWEHENEFRAALTNTFGEFNEPKQRNVPFEWNILKGIIFGINTSEYDKKRILNTLAKHKADLEDFTFYQAEYDEEKQEIVIRKKAFWKL